MPRVREGRERGAKSPDNAPPLPTRFAGHSPAGIAHPGQPPQGPSALHAPLEDDEAQVNEIHEAMEVLKKARLRLDTKNKRLLGEVLLAEGIILGLLGIIGGP